MLDSCGWGGNYVWNDSCRHYAQLRAQMFYRDQHEIQKEVQYSHERYLGDSIIRAREQAENSHHDTLIFVFFIVLILSAVGFGATLFLKGSSNRKEKALALRNRWSGWN